MDAQDEISDMEGEMGEMSDKDEINVSSYPGWDNLTDAEKKIINDLLVKDAYKKVKKYFVKKIIDVSDVLYFISCVQNEQVLPQCLKIDNFNEAQIRRLSLLVLTKILHDITSNNYIMAK